MPVDKNSQNIIEYTIQAADFYGVPRADALRIAAAESSMGRNTANYKNKNYVGPFQLGEAAAKDVGVTDRNDPKQNVFGGVAYYKQMLDANQGNRDLALASYNAGLGRVRQAGGDISSLPIETQNYVKNTPKINLAKYGVTPEQEGLATVNDEFNLKETATNIAKEKLEEKAKDAITEQLFPSSSASKATLKATSQTTSPSAFSIGNIGSRGNAILPAAGAYGMYDLFENKRRGGRAVIQGAASGAAMGSYFGPPGAAIGAGVGTLIGTGAMFANKPPQTKKEEKRWQKLAEQGLEVPIWVKEGIDIKAKNAGYRADLSDDFIGFAPTAGKSSGGTADEAGSWVNNPFAKTRDEKYLTGKDIWGYAVWAEKLGNSWMNTTPDKREQIADEALKRGLVNEAKGTINIKNDPEFWKFAQDLIIAPSSQAQKMLQNNSVRTAMSALESGNIQPVSKPIA